MEGNIEVYYMHSILSSLMTINLDIYIKILYVSHFVSCANVLHINLYLTLLIMVV